ncbi:hypothetical protein PC39_14547 [Salinisphaera sp. PC39]|uniref:hypothetical protein n=1 Tax=Salinisphaera sp. PC39 TaxID=1304156 RepID=UPI00333F7937
MMHDTMWFGGHWLFMLLWVAIILPPFWQIFSKAGFSGWLSLLMLIPLANLVVLYIVAFAEWPASKPAAGQHDDSARGD